MESGEMCPKVNGEGTGRFEVAPTIDGAISNTMGNNLSAEAERESRGEAGGAVGSFRLHPQRSAMLPAIGQQSLLYSAQQQQDGTAPARFPAQDTFRNPKKGCSAIARMSTNRILIALTLLLKQLLSNRNHSNQRQDRRN